VEEAQPDLGAYVEHHVTMVGVVILLGELMHL
jgi:hypothetical protein